VTTGGSRDLEAVRDGLRRWLRAHRDGDGEPAVAPLTRPAAGLSSDTLFVEVTWTGPHGERGESLVARLPPQGEGLFPEYDLARQGRIQSALAEAGVPVAPQLAVEPDPAWVGAPFLLMRRVPGRVLVLKPAYLLRGWLRDSPPADQGRLHRGFLDALAAIHRLDWRGLGLDEVALPGGTGLDAQLDWWGGYIDWAAPGEVPTLVGDALAWCRANRPSPEPPASLLWGDVQLVNAVFDDHLGTAAVLDWEMASAGPAEIDLGWFLALHHTTVVACGGTDLPGFPGRDQTIAACAERLGRPVLDLGWFEVFAMLRSTTLLLRAARLLSARGVDSAWLLRGNPTLDLLAEAIAR
jgi:aminoglycoside phosphotransferase (APT) family kinase protein